MRYWPVLVAITALIQAGVADAQSLTARQVVLQQSDVPGAVLLKSRTHVMPGFGLCTSAYQSAYGSGLGGTEAIYSAAYQCPSASTAADQFAQFAETFKVYYDRSTWHYKVLPAVLAGRRHAAWYNQGMLGVTNISGKSTQSNMITMVFQRNSFLAFV